MRATPPAISTDHVRRRDLRTMKRRATGLLVFITALWAVLTISTDAGGWIGYVRAAAEASMIGALADWFAVTAIFRHPLRLPIPHTAIIIERKDQFGRTLGEFVQENFLSADVIGTRLRSGRYVERAARWLEEPANAASVAASITGAGVAIADLIRDEDAQPLIAEAMERGVRALPLARIAGNALETMTAQGRHRELLHSALVAAERFVAENRESLKLRFSKESPWWLPGAIESRIFERLIDGVSNLLHDAAADDNHQLRGAIDGWLRELAVRLQTSPELAQRIDTVRDELLTHEQLREWSSSIWTEIKDNLRAEAIDPDSGLRRRVADALAVAGRRTREDVELLERLERLLESAARQLADRFHDELADLVAGTIARWNAAETADRLELLLGRDLQFIRINGTIVGGLAGLAIYSVARLIG